MEWYREGKLESYKEGGVERAGGRGRSREE
jgi:hypothetical protein